MIYKKASYKLQLAFIKNLMFYLIVTLFFVASFKLYRSQSAKRIIFSTLCISNRGELVSIIDIVIVML
jgi:hypothetical protein